MNTQNKPLILITNDDGYNAPGLQRLIDAVKPLGDIIVSAPERGASGMSHAITIALPLRANLIKQTEGLTIYKINGTPVDCIKLAINKLAPRKPDIVLSGINHGSNSSVSVVYSGTMGGAMEGVLNGIPAIGLSLCSHNWDADFSTVCKYSTDIINHVLQEGLPTGVGLNVNFPVVTEKEFKGIKVCRQAKGRWVEEFEERTDPHGGKYYWLTGNFENHENNSEDTDEWALSHNYASVVPVNVDFTDYTTLKKLNKLNSKL